jgi:nitrogen regulatory protein PII
MVSPEREYIQFLVPDGEVDQLMEAIVVSGNLHLPGAGAVFAVPCDDVVHSEDFLLWSSTSWESDTFNASTVLKENLTAIFCIVQKDQTESVSRAAMQAGAHGPIVFYCEGRGLRDRLGWLKITRQREKEVVVVIVDNADAIAVTEAMIDAGDIDLPGRGFLFRMPVQKGVVNIGSTFGRHRHAANMQQIIAAIDEIKGGSTWRDQRVNELVGTGQSAGLNLFGKVRERVYLKNQCSLNCIVGRKDFEPLVDAALQAGAPGANVSFAKFFEVDNRATARGVRYHRERGIIRFILPEDRLQTVLEKVQERCAENSITEVCMYSTPVTRAITYIADPSDRNATTNRPSRQNSEV